MAKNEETLIKEALKQGNVVIGTQQTLKQLKQGKLKKVYLAINCPEKLSGDIQHLSKLAKIPVIKLKKPNDELGVFCKKYFSVSVLGIK